ncbi:MAG: glycosyltransferase [Carnobacterium sp.]|nr:glycosyltransferase [Carnobacterium sp.]
MDKNKYSVLMSVYCNENPDFFIESIESMLKQTIKPDEIVIVKDGPLTVELDNIIDLYVEKEKSLYTIISLERNQGLGLALNKGLENCRNELVARMDTDDISFENRCELQLAEFKKNSKLSINGAWTNEFFDDPSHIVTSRIVPETHKEIKRFSRRRSPFNHPTVMYKKSAVLAIGGYRDILRKEDIDLFVRMIHNGSISMNIPQPLLYYRSNKDNYKRRKSWTNCKSYIFVIYSFWKAGYSSIIDLVIVTLGQIGMYITPVWVIKIVSDSVLRKKLKK